MEINGTTIIGASAGTAMGVGTGLAIGAKKASKFLASKGISKGMKLDQYVDARKTANLENLIGASATQKHITKAMKEVGVKAAADYKNLVKKAGASKNKYALVFAAVGLAIGSLATLLISKHSNKSSKAE